MAMGVTIDPGPISAEDRLRDVPQNKWHDLMLARRQFMEIKLSHDCRCLVEFVNDTELMYQALGFENPEAMIRDGYKLEPAEIKIAVQWLKLNPTDKPVPIKVTLGKHGGARRSKEAGNQADNVSLKHGNSADYIKARMERDGYLDLLAEVEFGAISARQAAIQVGYIKGKTVLQQLRSWWKKANAQERETFRKEINNND